MTVRPHMVVLRTQKQGVSVPAHWTDAFEITYADTPADALDKLKSSESAGILVEDSSLLDTAQILESIREGIAVVDRRTRVVWHNKAFVDFSPKLEFGQTIYQAIGGESCEGPAFCPLTDCFHGKPFAHSRLKTSSGKHLELRVQPLGPIDSTSVPPAPIEYVVCLVRDITFEVRDREKLIAIHRAGLELSHLTQAELAEMSTSERIDLLKANILQYSQNILSFKNLEIRLLEPLTNRLNILLSEGMSADAHHRELFAGLEGNGVTGFVAASGASYLCDDVFNDPLYLKGALDARSSLTVPLFYRDRVVGTFNVESPQPRHFTESDREFLEVFAREIALALHTLDLLQAEKKHGGSASVEEIVTEVSLPVDEIVADTIRMFELVHQTGELQKEPIHELIRRVLVNARTIKSSIQKVNRRFETRTHQLSPAETSLLAGRRILLADADPAIRRSAHSLIGRVGCDVDTVRDGQEAIRLAKQITYDVIMGDIRLPDMNGYEFFQSIRAVAPTTPIVLLTGFGYDSNHCMVRARQEGLRVVLYKPFRMDRLCEAIEDALDPQLAQAARTQAARLQNKQPLTPL